MKKILSIAVLVLFLVGGVSAASDYIIIAGTNPAVFECTFTGGGQEVNLALSPGTTTTNTAMSVSGRGNTPWYLSMVDANEPYKPIMSRGYMTEWNSGPAYTSVHLQNHPTVHINSDTPQNLLDVPVTVFSGTGEKSGPITISQTVTYTDPIVSTLKCQLIFTCSAGTPP